MTPADVRSLRRQAGWSQRDLSRRMHVSLATVKSWEAGRRKITPSGEVLLRLVVDQRDTVEETP